MKRLLCILLCLALMLPLATCAGTGSTGSESESASISDGGQSSLPEEEAVTVPYTRQMSYAVSVFGAGLKNQTDMSAVVPTMELLFSAALVENSNGTDKTALQEKYPGKAVILETTVEELVRSVCGPDATVRHSTPSDYDNFDVNYYEQDGCYVMAATGVPASYTPYFLKCQQKGDEITAQVVLLRFEEEDLETMAYYDENGLKLGTVPIAEDGSYTLPDAQVEALAAKLPQRTYTFLVQGDNYDLTGVQTS